MTLLVKRAMSGHAIRPLWAIAIATVVAMLPVVIGGNHTTDPESISKKRGHRSESMTDLLAKSMGENNLRLHSWLSPHCRVADSRLEGIGVFAAAPIAEGELICVWGGVVYTAAEVEALGETFPHFHTHPIEVAEGFYLASNSLTAIDDAERFNHSCDPNVGVKGQILVQARRAIVAGEELTFDYETTDVSMTPFECRCGAANCRQLIDGNAWKSPAFQQANAGWLSPYIAERVSRQALGDQP